MTQPPRFDKQVQPEIMDVQFELIPSNDVFIPKVEAVIVGNEMAVRGIVRRRLGNCCDTTKGTINVSVLTPKGDVFDSIDIMHSPRDIPNTGPQS